MAPAPAEADVMSKAAGRSTRVTARAFTSYEKSVAGPSRSDTKYTLPPIHIGSPSLDPGCGTFTTLESARLAIQIGVVWPPR